MLSQSSKARKIPPVILMLILLPVAFLALRPMPKASIDHCVQHLGRGSEVVKGDGEGDVVVTLKNDKNYYYINRAKIDGAIVYTEL